VNIVEGNHWTTSLQ